jgi:outer membrane biosynthesis protein TonB
MLKNISVLALLAVSTLMSPTSAFAADSTPEIKPTPTVNLMDFFNKSYTPEVTAPVTAKLNFEKPQVKSIAKPQPKPAPKVEESQKADPVVAIDPNVAKVEESSVKQVSTVTPDSPTPPTAAKATAPAPQVAVSPGSAQAEAANQMKAYGWGADQLACLIPLWQKESGWNSTAANPSSGAYGIPQSLPGNKMASAGDDWQTNPATQIKWGLGYIAERYKTPCGAWNHSIAVGWY